MTEEKQLLQWHPAFFAGFQIEFEKEADKLTFENEYQLGTKPKQIDVLIVKKDSEYQVKKNIGRIFRRYNIIEYKSPGDYLSIDDFYIGYAYVCLYKVDTGKINDRKMEDITLTFVSQRYPRNLAEYLGKSNKYRIEKKEAGIYYIYGDILPMQFIVTGELSGEENLWIRILTNHLKERDLAQNMLEKYEKNKDNKLYTSVMDIVVRANRKSFFKEGTAMSGELEKIIQEKMEAREKKMKVELEREVRQKVEQEVRQEVEQKVKQEVRQEVEQETRINLICKKLSKGYTVEQIADIFEEDPLFIKKVCEIAEQYRPDYNAAEICSKLNLVPNF